MTTFVWAQDQNQWVEPRTPDEFPDDGFCEQNGKCSTGGIPLEDLHALYQTCPIFVERAMAITAGKFGVDDKWHHPNRIDSMLLCEQEIMRRVTVSQDPAPEAVKFRDDRFALIRAVAELRASNYPWPIPVAALRNGFKFNWLRGVPNRNVEADDGTLATVIHAGLVGNLEALELLDQKVRIALAGPPPEPERVLSQEQQKLHLDQHYATGAQSFCIVYATATGSQTYMSARGTSFTRPGGQSAVDIGVPSFARLTDNPTGVQE
jgi:hypothetical protein